MPDPREQAEAVAKFMDRKWCGSATCDGTCVPDYADDLNAMREVEDEIERRGLIPEYVAELRRFWKESNDVPEFYPYFLIRATALQRLAAAARVIEEVSR